MICYWITDNQEQAEEIFLSCGFRECYVEPSRGASGVEIFLVKNSRQRGTVTVAGNEFDGPKGIGWASVMEAKKKIEARMECEENGN